MDLKLRLLISVILLGLFFLFKILLTITKKIHSNNPEHQAEQRRREEAYRKKVEAENEALMQEYMNSGSYADGYDDATFPEEDLGE